MSASIARWEKLLAVVVIFLTSALVVVPFFAFLFQTGVLPAYSEYCQKNDYTAGRDCVSYHTLVVWGLRIGNSLAHEHGLITAIFTAILALFTGRLYWATAKLTDISRQEFHANHFPRLVVRRVRFVEDPPTRVSYVITNVGDADAVIEGSDVSLQVKNFDSPLPFPPPYNYPGNGRLNGTKIAVGDTARFDIESPDVKDQVAVVERQLDYRPFLLGWMLYRNPGGHRRYTAFCRIYDPAYRGFIKPRSDDAIPEYDRYEYIT